MAMSGLVFRSKFGAVTLTPSISPCRMVESIGAKTVFVFTVHARSIRSHCGLSTLQPSSRATQQDKAVSRISVARKLYMATVQLANSCHEADNSKSAPCYFAVHFLSGAEGGGRTGLVSSCSDRASGFVFGCGMCNDRPALLGVLFRPEMLLAISFSLTSHPSPPAAHLAEAVCVSSVHRHHEHPATQTPTSAPAKNTGVHPATAAPTPARQGITATMPSHQSQPTDSPSHATLSIA